LVDNAIEAFRAAVNAAGGDTDQRQLARRDLALSLFDRAKDLSHAVIPEKRDPGRALQLAREAVDLDPENGICWAGLGHALYRVGRFEEAHDAMQRGFGLRGPGQQAMLCHALILWELGQRDAALTRYNAARQSLEPKLESGTAGEIVLTLLAEFDAKRSRINEIVTQPD
jgi:Flp pilus assembly protein TadD